VLIYPVVLRDSVLYIIESESAEDEEVIIRDHATGVRLSLRLPALRAALALINKKSGIVAKYGF
jgi:hypothetical protein